jgi:hypothetical protein
MLTDLNDTHIIQKKNQKHKMHKKENKNPHTLTLHKPREKS